MNEAIAPNHRQVKRAAQQDELAFQRLRKAVLTGEFREGEPLREARLAREWNIGRTPLRQAVRRAAEFGYLTLRPNQAPIVRRLSLKDIENIYSLREALECLALKGAWDAISPSAVRGVEAAAAAVAKARNVTKRLEANFLLDKKLHGLWIGNCGNPWLVDSLERLFIYRPNQIAILRGHPQLAESAFEEHLEILDAINRKDLKRTEDLLRSHIRNAGSGLLRFIQRIGSQDSA